MRITRILFITAPLLLLTACTANSQSQGHSESKQPAESIVSLKIATLHASTQCGTSLETQWIAGAQQLSTVFQAARGQMISPSPPQSPIIDFEQYGALLVSMGQQRSGGYVIKLAREELNINGGVAEITVDWIEPAPGMMTTQVITHPCILLQVPRGVYQAIRVVDQSNIVRAELSVN